MNLYLRVWLLYWIFTNSNGKDMDFKTNDFIVNNKYSSIFSGSVFQKKKWTALVVSTALEDETPSWDENWLVNPPESSSAFCYVETNLTGQIKIHETIPVDGNITASLHFKGAYSEYKKPTILKLNHFDFNDWYATVLHWPFEEWLISSEFRWQIHLTNNSFIKHFTALVTGLYSMCLSLNSRWVNFAARIVGVGLK